MILEAGDKVLVSNRRMFDGDEARFFLGETIACEGHLLKIEGYSFVRDLSSGHIVKKIERRIKVISVASPGHIVYQVANEINVHTADIASGNGDAMLMDGSQPIMNLSERTHCGHF